MDTLLVTLPPAVPPGFGPGAGPRRVFTFNTLGVLGFGPNDPAPLGTTAAAEGRVREEGLLAAEMVELDITEVACWESLREDEGSHRGGEPGKRGALLGPAAAAGDGERDLAVVVMLSGGR